MRHWRRGLAGIAVVAATLGVAATTGASSVPPGTDGGGTSIADPREALVDEIVASYGSEDIPLDHECVSDAVTAVPAADIDALLSILAGEDAVTATGTEPASPPTTTALQTDVDALGDDILLCVDGDADPELVEQVVTILEQSDDVPELDLDCARRMLSIVPDDVLELVIADPMGTGPLDSADIDTTAPLFMLLACSVSDPFAPTPVSTA
jgi:hypothetical protein